MGSSSFDNVSQLGNDEADSFQPFFPTEVTQFFEFVERSHFSVPPFSFKKCQQRVTQIPEEYKHGGESQAFSPCQSQSSSSALLPEAA
jgi:hypothetical protein